MNKKQSAKSNWMDWGIWDVLVVISPILGVIGGICLAAWILSNLFK